MTDSLFVILWFACGIISAEFVRAIYRRHPDEAADGYPYFVIFGPGMLVAGLLLAILIALEDPAKKDEEQP